MKNSLLLLSLSVLCLSYPVSAGEVKGVINFENVPVTEVLPIYQSLSGLELVIDSRVQGVTSPITMKTTEPLSRTNAAKLIEKALLTQAAIVITRLDEKRALVSLNEAAYVAQPASSAAKAGDHSSVIRLSSQDVDTNSVRLCTQPGSPVQNVTFRYINKSSTEVKSIAHSSDTVAIMKDGVLVAKSDGATGFMHGTNYVGLVLIFDSYDEAELTVKTLRGL